MAQVWLYSIAAVLAVSAVSLVGIFTISIATERLKGLLFVLVAFAAGSLFGDVFFHLLPEYIEEQEFNITGAAIIMLGIVSMLIIEKFVHWRHCHMPTEGEHKHPYAIMNLVGDTFHNFIDGVVVAASFLISPAVGIATTIAVVLHEIPQEIADFGVLLKGGFKKSQALLFNFLSALFAVVGAVVTLFASNLIKGLESSLVIFTVGIFIYIAGSDLIPEIHKEVGLKRSFAQLIAFVIGVIIMAMLLLLE